MSVQKKVWRERAKDGGVIPVTGCPHVGDKAKEGQRAPKIRARSKHEHLNHRKHSFTDVVSGLYLRSMRFGRNEFVVEVVVHGSSREVVIHVRFWRGT